MLTYRMLLCNIYVLCTVIYMISAIFIDVLFCIYFCHNMSMKWKLVIWLLETLAFCTLPLYVCYRPLT